MTAVAVAALALSTSPVRANVFLIDGADPRIASPRTGDDRDLAAVGLVTTEAAVAASDDGQRVIRLRSSGFLVSPCLVLTNFHSVFGLAYDGPDPERSYAVRFAVGADPERPFRAEVRGTPVAWGDYNRRKEHDWALVRLEQCAGSDAGVGWLALKPLEAGALVGGTVALAGYPADKAADRLWLESRCRIEGVQPGTGKLLHDCSVRSGASGGPLVMRGPDGSFAVALQCGELNPSDEGLSAFDPRHANTAVTIAEVLADPAAARLIADDLAAPAPSPAAPEAQTVDIARLP